jgi:glycerol-3-phosphate dehydrogenase
MSLGPFDRSSALEALRDPAGGFDVLVIGGGITGAGVALDAADRGLRTALVERDDFASGTSSKSSKMVHGGLRYLQQGDVRLVYEALAERQRLMRNAPHLVRELPFLLPILSRDGLINRKIARTLGTAMWMYDLTGGARIGKFHRKVKAAEAVELFPALPGDRVAGGYICYECGADDARLTLAIARTAALDHSAVVANGIGLVGFDRQVDSIRARLRTTEGETITVGAKVLVNATGVWADSVVSMGSEGPRHTLRPAKGTHITVPWKKMGNSIAVIVPVRGDRRSVFVVPWGESAYIGTTDTDYDGPLDDPQCTPDDVAYLVDAINRSTNASLTLDDITGTWAGLRPLVDDGEATERTADLSRRHRVEVEGRIVTVTGGKLTTYREMAADTVDAIGELVDDGVPAFPRRSRTAMLPIRGAEGLAEARDELRARRGLAPQPDTIDHLLGRYGGEASVIVAMIDNRPALAERLDPRLPYLAVEATYAARYEMVNTLDDVLSRRLRSRIRHAGAAADIAPAVSELVGPELGWDSERRVHEVESFLAGLRLEREAAGLPDLVASRP